MYSTPYRFGCEPYLVLSRRHAVRRSAARAPVLQSGALSATHSSVPVWAQPEYHEGFVGYGKDRVSYTYELAARGVRLLVQPELFLVHYTTVQRGTAYSHSPKDWMVGETCWPGFAGAPG